MTHKGSLKGLAIALIFSSQSLWAQVASSTTLSAPANTSTVKAPAEKEQDKKYSGAVKVTTLGRSVQDKNLKSRVGWTFIEAGVDTEFTEWLAFNVGVVGVYGEGAGQNYLSKEGGGSNLFLLDYASVILKPFTPLTLKAGVIGYQINPIYTTMTPATSLGAEQKFELATPEETFKFTAMASEIVPSVGITKGLVEEEKNPFFITGTIMGELNAKAINSSLKVAGTQFRYGNLPKAQAEDSLQSGNSVGAVAGVGNEMHYIIGFAGTEVAAQLETNWTSRFRTTLKGVQIKNDRAFDENNEGRAIRLDLRGVFGNIAWKPSFTAFEIEADTTPAGYTILANRYNNRRGQVVGLSMELIKQKVTFFSNYTKGEEIVDSPFLTDREIFNLGVEVAYDLF